MTEAEQLHSCGYHCNNPACILTQRNQLVVENAALRIDAALLNWLDHNLAGTIDLHNGTTLNLHDNGLRFVLETAMTKGQL